MRIILTVIIVYISTIVNSQDFGQFIISGQDICHCKVYFKLASIESLLINDTINYNKSLNSSLIIYYPEDTIELEILNSSYKRRGDFFLTSVKLVDSQTIDSLTYTVNLIALYDEGSLIIKAPLKRKVDDGKLFLMDCED